MRHPSHRNGEGITIEEWEKMLASFREFPGAITRAAEAAGVSRLVARKAFHKGVRYLDKPSIRYLLEDEQRSTRAALDAAREAKVEKAKTNAERDADRQYAEAEKARRDVIEARRSEAEIVRGERGNVLALIAATSNVLRGAMAQAKEIEEAIAKGVDPATNAKLTLTEKVEILTKAGKLVRTASEAATDVVKLERLLLGEPTEIVGTRNLDAVSEEDAIREMEAAGEMARRMRERRARRLQLIQGGKSNGASNGANGHG